MPQNQAAPPTQMVAAATGTCLPAHGISPKSAAAGECQALRNSSSAPWPGKQGQQATLLKPEISAKPKEDFEPKWDLPQCAEHRVLHTSREFGLGDEGWGFFSF